jgi:hypothetical protein
MSAEATWAVERLSVTHRPEPFESGVGDLDRWLRNSARTAGAAGTAATYVLCQGDRVVGFYALAMSAVVHAGAPSRLRRVMPDPESVVLLARLAVDRSQHGRGRGVTCLSTRCVAACEAGASSARGPSWMPSTSERRTSTATSGSATSTRRGCADGSPTSPRPLAAEVIEGQRRARRQGSAACGFVLDCPPPRAHDGALPFPGAPDTDELDSGSGAREHGCVPCPPHRRNGLTH